VKITRTKARPPYNEKGNTNFPKRGVPGVYLIYKAGKLRYVGFSATNVYKTMYRHFQEWNDNRQVRVTYKVLKEILVRVIYCSPTNAAKIERALIVKYKPQDNPDKLTNYILTPGEQSLVDKVTTAPIDDVPF
jgi:excinuclease UvrABC nuclease subunit